MKRIVFILCCLGGLFSLALSGRAEPPQRDIGVVANSPSESVPSTGEYWALLIGIDRYRSVEPLATAVRDAKAIRDVLVERYGFRRDHVTLLVDGQATRRGIEDALYAIGKKAKDGDSVFIYYAGHGQIDLDSQRGFWVPVDGEAQSPGTFISNARVRDEMAAMKAKHVYLVADSCFSGSLFGQSRALPPLTDKVIARLSQAKSRWGLTSGMNEPVADVGKGGHSIFAYFFLTLLRENEDAYLIPSRISEFLTPLVANNSDQKPRSQPLQGAGDEGGQFVFRLAGAGKSAAAGPARPDPPAEPPKPIDEARLRPQTESGELVLDRKEQIRKIIERALQLIAEHKWGSVQLGDAVRMYLAAGDFAGALARVNEVKDRKDQERLLEEIADAQATAGFIRDAFMTVERTSGDLRHSGWLHIGREQLKRGDRSGANETFRKLPGGWFSDIGSAYARHGDIATARQILESNRSKPQSRHLLYAIAVAQADKGDFLGAFQSAGQLSGYAIRAYCLAQIAKIQAKKGDHTGAASAFRLAKQTAVQIVGKEDGWATEAGVMASIAGSQAEAGNLMGAMETAHSIEDAEKKFEALIEIGTAQVKRGDVVGGVKTVQQALRSFTGRIDSSDFGKFASAQAEAGDVTGAILTVNDPRLKLSDNGNVWEAIAKAQATSGDVAGALALADNQQTLSLKLAVMKGVVAALGGSDRG